MPYPVRKADHGSIKRLCRATLGFKVDGRSRKKTGPEGPAKSIREAKRLGEAPRVPEPARGRMAGAEGTVRPPHGRPEQRPWCIAVYGAPDGTD